MTRSKNPRLVLIARLQDVARQIRSTIGQWRPDGGMTKHAAWGGETYLENNPAAWEEIAELGGQMVLNGAWLIRYALEQKRAAQDRLEVGQ